MRLPVLAAAVLGLALIVSPASAKDKKPSLTPPPVAIDMTIDQDLTHDPENVLLLDLSDGGRVAIRLKPQWAPEHVARIKALAGQGFYNGIIFHRVIDGFMAQTGDPTGTGNGGSPLPDLKAEFNNAPHLRGMVSMARTNDPDSANSQFFIMFYPKVALDHKYTVFGRVIAWLEWVDAIQRGEPPANPTRILHASLASDNKGPPAITAAAPPAAPSVTELNTSPSN